jgi:hypothetical protein
METIAELEHLKPVELLTTGQVIDRLKVGEFAEIVETPSPFVVGYRIYFDGTYYWWEDKSAKDRFYLNHLSVKLKWKIIPKTLGFVTFEEAMKAVKEGIGATYHFEDDGYGGTFDLIAEYQLDELAAYSVTFADLFKSRWTIKK